MPSRRVASEVITAGRVTVDGAPARKPAAQVAPTQQLAVAGTPRRWVSRGGDKLDAAIDELGIDVAGRDCLDAGASTGGFTDVLLARGAASVVAVDVGYGQLAWPLRTDSRVVVVERTHVRDLTEDHLAGRAPDLVVADLSFISLRSVLPTLRALLGEGVEWCCLVKPQFEVGRALLDRRGVVRAAHGWAGALEAVRDVASALDLAVMGGAVSTVPGPAGNVEFFVRLADAHLPTTGCDWKALRDSLLQRAARLRDDAKG